MAYNPLDPKNTQRWWQPAQQAKQFVGTVSNAFGMDPNTGRRSPSSTMVAEGQATAQGLNAGNKGGTTQAIFGSNNDPKLMNAPLPAIDAAAQHAAGVAAKPGLPAGLGMYHVADPQQVTAPAPPAGFAAPAVTTPNPFAAATVSGAPASFTSASAAAPVANTTTADPTFQTVQQNLATQLAARAQGNDPLVAAQMNQQRAQNQAAIFSQLASSRGAVNPLAARAAMDANAAQGAQVSRDTVMAQLAAQQGAQGQLAGLADQARGQDLAQANMYQQIALANQQQAGETGRFNAANAQQANMQAFLQAQENARLNAQMAQQAGSQGFAQQNENARMNAQLGQAFNEAQLRYMSMGLDAQKANQMAALETQKYRVQAQAANQAFVGNMAKGAGGALDSIAGMFKTAAPVAGTVVGGMYGGPAGAAAGGMAGQAMGNAVGGSSVNPSAMGNAAPQDEEDSVNPSAMGNGNG